MENKSKMKIKTGKIKLVKNLGKQKINVYDIGVNDDNPYFFANNILVHNSVYFSLDTAIKRNKQVKDKFKNFEFNKENFIKYYDDIAQQVNESFNDFLKKKFNINEEYATIKAGRELVASSGLFVTKKRYAVLMYEKDGMRLDKDGKYGKIKAMGLDLKRSDTPEIVQKFLEEILMDALLGKSRDEISDKIKEFKNYFRSLKPWQKGVPKRVNGLSTYTKKFLNIKKSFSYEFLESEETKLNKKQKDKKDFFAVPGHVMASINYNKLRRIYKDNVSMEIQDGAKIIVCYLKENEFKMNSVAYPIDLLNLPDWFKKLPFDDEEMERTVLDKKIYNLLEIMGWDLKEMDNYNNFEEFFS